jgi:hypothetical protein
MMDNLILEGNLPAISEEKSTNMRVVGTMTSDTTLKVEQVEPSMCHLKIWVLSVVG